MWRQAFRPTAPPAVPSSAIPPAFHKRKITVPSEYTRSRYWPSLRARVDDDGRAAALTQSSSDSAPLELSTAALGTRTVSSAPSSAIAGSGSWESAPDLLRPTPFRYVPAIPFDV